jgi:hypothetical protein
MIPNKPIVDAISLYSWLQIAVAIRRRTGQVLQWPPDLLRPAAMGDEPTELDVAWAADRLRALLGPDSDEEPDGPWLKVDSSAPANRVFAAVDARARNVVDQLAPAPPPAAEEHNR